MSTLSPKTRARNLQKALQEHLKQPVKLSQAYELIAREEGFKNWDTAAAKISGPTSTDWTSPELLPWKTIENFWQEDGLLLDKIIKNQPAAAVYLNEISKSMSITVITGRAGSGKTSLAREMMVRWPCKNRAVIGIPSHDNNEGDAAGQSITFSKAISAALRLAPDVVFIGELRNMEQLRMAVKLVDTGHNVIATLRSDYERPLYLSVVDAIPECAGTEELERFQDFARCNRHHVHIRAEWSVSNKTKASANKDIESLY